MENNENHEALLKHLEIQWQDHIQTRKQTWEALKISAILAVALVGLDWRVNHPIVTIVTSGLLAAVALFGMQITIRHRNNVEVLKFKRINELERQLGLEAERPLPSEIRWWDVFRIKKTNTSLFILRMQFVLLLFAVTYFIFRIILPPPTSPH